MRGSNPRREWELKLSSGAVVVWAGSTGEEAAKRYVEFYPAATVVAWRNADRHGLHQYGRGARIVEGW